MVNRASNRPADYGKRPVSGFESFLVTGLKFPKKPTKKFFDMDYEARQNLGRLFNPPPVDNTKTIENLVGKIINRISGTSDSKQNFKRVPPIDFIKESKKTNKK